MKVQSWCHGWHDGTWVPGAGTPVLLRMIMLRRQIDTCRTSVPRIAGEVTTTIGPAGRKSRARACAYRVRQTYNPL